MKEQIWYFGLIFLLMGIASYVVREAFPKIVTEYQRDTISVVIKDTVTIDQIRLVKVKAKLDTVWLSDTSRVDQWANVASLDTVLKPFQDTLSVQYYFPPINSFDLLFTPAPRPIEILTKEITVYKQDIGIPRILWFAAGLAGGYIVYDVFRK